MMLHCCSSLLPPYVITTTTMVQSINTQALWTLTSIARRPGLVVPQISVQTISDLDFGALQQKGGIRAIVLDKDNTITAPYSNEIHPKAKDGLDRALAVYGPDKVAILSNSAGTRDDADYRDAIAIEAALGIPVIRHDEKKPGGLHEVLEHFALENPAEICVVGDRLLTDVVFGNLHGMLSVHCLPLCEGPENAQDNWTAKLLRPAENTILYGNWFGGRYLKRQKMEHKYCQQTATTQEDEASS